MSFDRSASRNHDSDADLAPAPAPAPASELDAERNDQQARATLRTHVVQADTGHVAESAEAPAIAARGAATAAAALPHRDQIAASFGPGHDLSSIRAHVGGDAADAADELEADAYASGDDVVLAEPPDLHTAAHEAAHVVQQRDGVSLYGGVGKAGDVYEQNADAVADRVVAGKSAADLLPGASSGKASAGLTIQKKKGGKKKSKKSEKAKPNLERGNELTSHKSGSVKAKRDLKKLITATADERVEKLVDLLATKSRHKNQIFYHVITWLSGDNKDLSYKYTLRTGQTLGAALDRRLSERQAKYCRSVLEHGVPQIEDKLRLALGQLTGSAPDKKEVYALFEPLAPAEKLRIWDLMGTDLAAVDKGDRLKSQVDTAKAQQRHQLWDEPSDLDSVKRGPITPRRHRHRGELLDLKDAELTALAKSCRGSLNLKRDKLGEAIPKWLEDKENAAPDVRAYVTRPGSMFVTYLEEQSTFRSGLGLFTGRDREYAIAMIRDFKPAPESFFNGETPEDELSEKGKEKREDTKREEGAKIGELVAYVDRKDSRQNQSNNKSQWKTLKEKIEDLSPEERDAYLRSFLSSYQQKLWDDPDHDFDDHERLRDVAIRLLDAKLQHMGMVGDLSKGDTTRKKLLDAFRLGATSNTGSGGSIYQRIKKLVKDGPGNPDKFGGKALALLRKLRGAEFAQLRGDRDLMQGLETKSGKKYWPRLQLELGLTVGEHDGAHGEVDKDLLHATTTVEEQIGGFTVKHEEAKHDLDEAQQLGAREAELMPSHWAMILTAALKHAHTLRRTEVSSVVTRAWTAGHKRERLTQTGPLKLSGTRTLDPMTASAFVKAVFASLPQGARAILDKHKDGKLAVAYHALEHGERPTVNDQVKDGIFVNPFKATTGYKISYENLAHTWQDLEGPALLEEWSNIKALRALNIYHERAKAGGDTAKAKRYADQIRDFILDVSDARIKMLEWALPRKQQVEMLAKLRSKLASTAKSDPEVIEILQKQNFTPDELSLAKTETMGLLDQQKLRSTGAQYNTLLGTKKEIGAFGQTFIGSSSKSAQTKESTSELLGHHRMVEDDLRSGKSREEVGEERGKDVQDSQDELARRGENFDKMQKKFNRFAMGIVKALVYAAVLAAFGAITVLTGGVGGLAGAGLLAGKVALTQAVLKGVESALVGDSFNTTKAAWDVVFKTMVTFVGGVGGNMIAPELLEGLGFGTDQLGDGFTSTTTFLAPTDLGQQALLTTVEGGFKKGLKGMISATIATMRSHDHHPEKWGVAAIKFGAPVLALGASVGSAVYSDFHASLFPDNQQTTEPTTPQEKIDQKVKLGEQKGSEQLDKLLAKMPKIIKKAQKPLVKLLDRDTEEGSDLDIGFGLGDLVAGTLARLDTRLAALETHRRAASWGMERRYVYAKMQPLQQRRDELATKLAAFEDKKRAKGKETEVEGLEAMNNEVVALALQVNQELDALEANEPLQSLLDTMPGPPPVTQPGGQVT